MICNWTERPNDRPTDRLRCTICICLPCWTPPTMIPDFDLRKPLLCFCCTFFPLSSFPVAFFRMFCCTFRQSQIVVCCALIMTFVGAGSIHIPTDCVFSRRNAQLDRELLPPLEVLRSMPSSARPEFVKTKYFGHGLTSANVFAGSLRVILVPFGSSNKIDMCGAETEVNCPHTTSHSPQFLPTEWYMGTDPLTRLW